MCLFAVWDWTGLPLKATKTLCVCVYCQGKVQPRTSLELALNSALFSTMPPLLSLGEDKLTVGIKPRMKTTRMDIDRHSLSPLPLHPDYEPQESDKLVQFPGAFFP